MEDNKPQEKTKRSYAVPKDTDAYSKVYSIDDIIGMITKGEIKLSVDTIKGIHGADYVRAPSTYDCKGGEWTNTNFEFENQTHTVVTLIDNEGVVWYQFAQVLKMLRLYTCESDSKGFEAHIPYPHKRCYSPRGKGVKRTFVTIEALEHFGLGADHRPIVKRKVSLQCSGVTIYNVNMPYLINGSKRIMDQLDSIDDKIFMCDVYRTLSQLE